MSTSRHTQVRAAIFVAVAVVAALTSEAADWRPPTLVLVLAAAMVVADVATFSVRRVRISAGLMVQTMVMALLGPAPAVAIGAGSTAFEARFNRVPLFNAINNVMVFAVLGLAGGVLFDVLRDVLGVDRHDTTYALLTFPVYVLLAAADLVLIAVVYTDLPHRARRRILLDVGIPTLPLELANGMLAAASVLVWSEVGLGAAVALVLVVAVSIPLARTLADSLTSGDDLIAMRQVSDERAAEVVRLSSDRDRLLTELLSAEGRERARLAESLHDGPMQRLMAMRQDVVEGRARPADLDRAIAETRAIISAYHPATVRELGFEASLRAAVAPFPAAQSIRLTVRSTLEDSEMLLPMAQELVVNAVKHAAPSAIDVVVERAPSGLVLEVNDDGVGIDTARAGRAVRAGHVGLAMVRRRVEDAGGELEIATRADGGTRSRITLPESRMAPG